MFKRVPEPELMLDLTQCRSYHQEILDDPSAISLFLERYDRFVQLSKGHLVDLGSGPCNFIIALCLKYPDLKVVCYENSKEMIEIAKENILQSGLVDRIKLIQDDFFSASGKYDAVIASRVLHHVSDTENFWKLIDSLSNNILICDLERPESLDFVEEVCKSESIDFKNSLLAAYNFEEVSKQIENYPYEFVRDLKPGEFCVVTKRDKGLCF